MTHTERLAKHAYLTALIHVRDVAENERQNLDHDMPDVAMHDFKLSELGYMIDYANKRIRELSTELRDMGKPHYGNG